MTEEQSYPLDQWAYLEDKPECRGLIRSSPADFVVHENLGFQPEGNGKHLWLQIEKTGLNTIDIGRDLARVASVHPKEIGVSGQKDRHAVTTQWFSVLAETDPAGTQAKVTQYCEEKNGIALVESVFHPGKLRRGSHRSNAFRLIVRNIEGDLTRLDDRLKQIQQQGVPNYFGSQRFGRNGKNMQTAWRWFCGQNRRLDRQARSMALSSARSWVFNEVLSERIRQGDWHKPLIGDVLMLDGSQSWFVHDGSDEQVVDRMAANDLHITGPMWGKGDLPTAGLVQQFEQQVVDRIPVLPDGLVKQGLSQQRRSIRLMPVGLEWTFLTPDTLQLIFHLPRGSFATAVLRELVDI